jgi:hypothetical protein
MKAFKTIAVLASLAISSVAVADDAEGIPGTLTVLEVNTTSADAYLGSHGRIVIASGKNLGNKDEYRWGGVACGTRVMPESMVAMLQRALESGTQILPRYQTGQGDLRCLVGFKLGS